jgi:hypothetical protein
MPLEKIYLESAIKRLLNYKDLGDNTFAQLTDDDFHFTPAEECNNIAIIIQHMHGNMLSRWTNFLNEDGEKEWRERDKEFVDQNFTKEQLLTLWEKGWKCFLNAVKSLSANDLEKTIYIRSQPLSVIDAFYRQFAHYPYHVGQIIYTAKILKNKNWQNLSVARGRSIEYTNELKNRP